MVWQLLRHSTSVHVVVNIMKSPADLVFDIGASLRPNLSTVGGALARLVGGVIRPREAKLARKSVAKAVDKLNAAFDAAKGGIKNGMAQKVGEAFSSKKVETEDPWISHVQSLLVEANGLYCEVLILVIRLEVVGAVDLGSLISELIEDRLVGEEKALELVRNYKLVSLNGGSVGGDRGGDSDNGAASALITEDGAVNLQAKLWKGDEARSRAGGIKCLEIGAY